MTRIFRSLFIAAAVPAALSAQTPAAPTKLDFSGIMFGAFSYKTVAGSQHQNKFDMERAYLNFRMPVADRLNIRVTADIAPQAAGTGYTFRAKYAFLQYDQPANSNGYSGFVRAGVLQTVAIEHMETFWPRWMGTVNTERFGYYSSADVGASAQLNFPQKKGELYAVVSNGNGYANPETDRFKSYAARLSLTPLAGGKHGVWTTFTVSPWFELNKGASKFATGGTGQVGAVGEGLTKNRYGLFAGIKDPNLVIAGSWSRRIDGTEAGANTPASPRAVTDVTGQMLGAFTVIRPFQLADAKSKAPVSIMARWDQVTPNTKTTSAVDHLYETSLIFDIAHSKRAQIALDYQETLGKVPAATIAPNKLFQIRMVANF